MGQIFGNIFDDEEEKKAGAAVNVPRETEPVTTTAARGESIFGDIFAETDAIRKEATDGDKPAEVAVEETGFLKKVTNAGKSVLKFGLDTFNAVQQRNARAGLPLQEIYYGDTKFVTDPVTGKKRLTTDRLERFNAATTTEEKNKIAAEATADIPLVKLLNTDTAKKIITTVSDKTSNVPLKTFARISALGDKTYEEAYSAWLAERDDPENPMWQKFLYELQDTGVQSSVGILLALGTSALTRNPYAGYATSGAFYTALSADEQLKERGKVDSLGNIAIDVVGDQVLNKMLLGVLGSGGGSTLTTALKGFGIEGSTEVSQSLLKYANDYGNAQTEEEKNNVLANAKNYVVGGGMALEFFVGGTVGAIAGGITNKIGGQEQPAPIPNQPTTRPTEDQKAKEPTVGNITAEIEGIDITGVRDRLSDIQRTLDPQNDTDVAIVSTLYDTLNDYATAFNDKPVFVLNKNTGTPLLEVETVRFPDGKFAVKYSVNTDFRGFASTYDFTQLFPDQKAATADAINAIRAQVETELENTTDPAQRAQLEQVLAATETKNAGAPEVAVATVKEDLKIITENSEQVVKGEAVDLPFGIKGFTHTLVDDAKFIAVSERSTGKQIAYARTKEAAIREARQVLESQGEEKAKSSIDKSPVLNSDKSVTQQSQKTKAKNKDKKPKTVKKQGVDNAKVVELEQQLRDRYNATEPTDLEGFTKADEMLNAISVEMELSQAGERIFLPHDATQDTNVIGVPSTFPEWVPENLRSKDLFNTVLKTLEVSKLSYPKGNRVRQRRLYQIILDELDAQLGIDTSDIRNQIIDLYDNQTQDSDQGEAAGGDGGRAQGGAGNKGGRGVNALVPPEPAKKYRNTLNVQDKQDVEELSRIFSRDAIADMQNGKMTNWRGDSYEDLGRVNIINETPKTLAEKLDGKIKPFELPTRTVYHGTIASNEETIMAVGFKKGTELKRDDFRGGGYGANQDSISFSTDPTVAANFTGSSPLGVVFEVSLKDDIKIVTVDGMTYAEDLNDYVKELRKQKIDAVYLESEKEVVVLNKKAIKKIERSKTFNVMQAKKEIVNYFNPPKSGNAFAAVKFDGDVWGALPEDTPAPLPQKLGGIEAINPVELPELVDITRELLGRVPIVTDKVLSKKEALGVFHSDPLNPRIKILADLFAQNKLPEATKVLAHEIGHMIDWLPDKTMSRGNLIGSLFSLRNFMSETFDPKDGSKMTSKERASIRGEVEREVMAERGIKDRKKLTLKDKATIKERYKSRLDLVIETDGYIKNEQIKKELLIVTRYWHPWDAAKSTPQYNKYRESARELYAEALSVLLVSPKKLSELAPTFYNEFFAALDAKPDVRNIYFEVQSLLSGDRELIVKRRREGVRRMFKEGDYKAIDLHNRRVAEKEARRARYWEHFKHTVIDKNFQIIDRVKKVTREGKTINPDENPIFFLEERNYLGGKIKALFEREFNSIYSTLNENEVLWEDFGEVLFYQRIASGDRSDVANPRGITPQAAQELLNAIKSDYGAARWQIMQEQAQKFRDAARGVTERAYEAGLYRPELYAEMQKNPAYVTFQVLDHLEDGMTSRVYKSLGTLKDITNPADATMLKVISTMRAAERNQVTQKTVAFLQAEFPTEIVEAKYSASKRGRFPIPSKDPNQELITFFEKGVLKGYYVDPYIAESINNQSVGSNAPIVPAIRWMNGTFFRPLFIQFNLGFQTMNLLRDFWRFYKNIPDMTLARAIKRYGQAGRVAKVRAFGLPKNPSAKDLEAQALLEQAEASGVLSVTFNDIISGQTELDKQVEKILSDTGIKDFQPKPTYEKVPRFAKPAVKVLNKAGILDVSSNILGFIENLGNLIETLPKAAGVFEYRGTTEEFLSKEQKSFIRRKIGSPDFLAGGTYKPITNEVFLFSNAIIQGIRADIEVASDPKTRSGFWWKTTKITFLPKLLMLAVLYGAFGDEAKELMESASEYDRTNYNIIPIGWDENGKAIYFRLPVDETSRFLGGILWKGISLAKGDQELGTSLMDVLSYTGGQIPSVSPAVQVTAATLQYLSGQNPYDAFRGRQVLSDTVFEAGGTESAKAYAGWVFQQLGGGIFYKFYHEPTPPQKESAVERFFNMPILGNIAGRFVRVSNYGQLEELRAIESEVSQERAKQTLKEREIVNDYVRKAQEQNLRFNTASLEREMVKELFDGLPKDKKELQKADRLIKKFKLQLKRGDAEPEVVALIDANTNDEKAAILKKIKSEVGNEEFVALRRDLISTGVVSVDVFQALNLDNSQ